MFGVLRSIFSQAQQSRNRESDLSAATLETLVLGTPVPTVRLVPVFTMSQLATRERTV